MGTGDFIPVSQGPVWGQHQTILRAEILGVISAFRFGLLHHQHFMVWTDNQQVFDTIQLFSRGGAAPDLMAPDHDLWKRLHTVVTTSCSLQLFEGIVKIRSHEDESAYPLVERWAIRGNDYADGLARTAIRTFPARLLDVWQRMKTSRQQIAVARDELHQLFVKVGQRGGSNRTAA